MSEALCICGHEKGEHTFRASDRDVTGGPRYPAEFRCACGCGKYRECVPWPTEGGNHWCDKFNVPCKVKHDPSGFMVGGPELWFDQREFESLLGPARFVKLQEQNPFGAAT